MKFCNTPGGLRVAYAIRNAERSNHLEVQLPLVLLHGFCEDHSLWSTLQSRLTAGPLVLIDLPGFGASEHPTQADIFTYAEAVKAVLSAENIARCVLVGHSMGGYVALEFAARWPEQLAGMGLFHAHPFEDSAERKMVRQRGIETLQAGKRDLYVTQLFPNLFAPKYLEHNSDTLNQLISNGKKQSAEGISAALQAMMTRRDHQQTLRETSLPVLFLLGEQDTLVPPESGLKAALMPDIADLHLLSEAAHMAMYECPEESAAILNSFWDFCQSNYQNRPSFSGPLAGKTM